MSDQTTYTIDKVGLNGTLTVSCYVSASGPEVLASFTSKALVTPSLSLDDTHVVTWRFDDLPAEMDTWFYSSHGATQNLFSGASRVMQPDQQKFVKQLAGAHKLLIRAEQAEGTVDLSFDVSGADDALTKLRQRCQTN
jgi:type VI secretion system VasI family protein